MHILCHDVPSNVNENPSAIRRHHWRLRGEVLVYRYEQGELSPLPLDWWHRLASFKPEFACLYGWCRRRRKMCWTTLNRYHYWLFWSAIGHAFCSLNAYIWRDRVELRPRLWPSSRPQHLCWWPINMGEVKVFHLIRSQKHLRNLYCL